MTPTPLTVVANDDTPPPEWPPATFTVTPVVDGDHDITTHAVRVELSEVAWRQLVGDIARALYLQPFQHLLMAAGRPHNDLAREDALTKLVARINGTTNASTRFTMPPMWDITPESADALAMALNDAAEEPAMCRCGHVVRKPSQLTTTCEWCVERLGGDGR